MASWFFSVSAALGNRSAQGKSNANTRDGSTGLGDGGDILPADAELKSVDLTSMTATFTSEETGYITVSLTDNSSTLTNLAPVERSSPAWYNWDGPIGRWLVPDFVNVGVGFSGIFGFGSGSSVELNWITHGPEASWRPVISATQAVGGGYAVDATINIGSVKYSGEASDITRSMVVTNTFGDGNIPTIWVGGALSEGLNAGGTGTFTYLGAGNNLYGGQLNLGVGLPLGPLPVNGAAGVSNTWILHDFWKK